ncbi:DNA-3-methyladenine glycosylase II [Paractinoplanes deccanensis]|uniref:DNA-3-methyladenine glycosylase II n=1 Tax=Paractinoplanes deccanensis TaxID=113561 RepID=A0ABQ3YHB2_9ACTN|nr:DNA-3-methyladenine glycosylase 2 family protein [Actinoplanes deccanensis]GID79389.1 DNA-3-methyladenine glycosylase II [Actinoplanes deccanensis]
MKKHTVTLEVAGPWSLATSRAYWAGFAPAALRDQADDRTLRTAFLNERDWTVAKATVEQVGDTASIAVSGPGDLDAAAEQVARFLSLDVDGSGWPEVGERDPVIGAIQKELPGLRPCGFHSPYEAAAWAVLSQRVRMTQAAAVRDSMLENGVFPAPQRLRTISLDLFGRKLEYLYAVAEAALDGELDGGELRALSAEAAIARVRRIKGLGPFAAELTVLRGANHPDALPRTVFRLDTEITARYGPGVTREEVSEAWRPYRTWASFCLRAAA